MSMFSLRTIIDDILLIVRNNNISESEDLSRAQIAAWVMHYKAHLIKQHHDLNSSFDTNEYEKSMTSTKGPIALTYVYKNDNTTHTERKTKEKLSDLFDSDPNYIIAVMDEDGCPILYMHSIRRHFHYFRKYTNRELTYDYINGHIHIKGDGDCLKLKNIYVKYISNDSEKDSEEEINIPEWMVSPIKELVFKNELAFMIKMPSDDDNNSTLDGIKPHGPQDLEK